MPAQAVPAVLDGRVQVTLAFDTRFYRPGQDAAELRRLRALYAGVPGTPLAPIMPSCQAVRR